LFEFFVLKREMSCGYQASDLHYEQLGRVDWKAWLIRLFSWDGALPAGILSAPTIVHILFPKEPAAVNFAAVFFPVVAFLVRWVVGVRHIRVNNCSEYLRDLQNCALVLGIVALAFIDCVGIVLQDVAQLTVVDFTALGVFASAIYLPPMAFALYPGRSRAVPVVVDHWNP